MSKPSYITRPIKIVVIVTALLVLTLLSYKCVYPERQDYFSFEHISNRFNIEFKAQTYAPIATTTRTTPEEPKCRVPVLDPWDPTIKKYIGKPTKTSCRRLNNYDGITYLDQHGYLMVNSDIFGKMRKDHHGVSGTYYCLDRGKTDHDIEIVFQNTLGPTSIPIPLKTDVVEIKCFGELNNIVHHNIMGYPANHTKDKLTPTNEHNLADYDYN